MFDLSEAVERLLVGAGTRPKAQVANRQGTAVGGRHRDPSDRTLVRLVKDTKRLALFAEYPLVAPLHEGDENRKELQAFLGQSAGRAVIRY